MSCSYKEVLRPAPKNRLICSQSHPPGNYLLPETFPMLCGSPSNEMSLSLCLCLIKASRPQLSLTLFRLCDVFPDLFTPSFSRSSSLAFSCSFMFKTLFQTVSSFILPPSWCWSSFYAAKNSHCCCNISSSCPCA
jgi:hypothetical protein